ncbi:MAG: choice-of-anchor D domain-containing protein [Proteobacteria bacterium]|nr:choice-of-anchor D domain-containing protein [Pseudomonadota bacterium]MBU1708482.1 choice-of-anchor D domain-containing protein [Pseudomonadota bacterium]
MVVTRPTAVATGPVYRYVGSNDMYHVKVLDSDDKVINYLGGINQFGQPRNIEVDPQTGDVYVLDDVREKIYVYTAYGERLLREISLESKSLPVDLAFFNNRLYILDQPLVRNIHGARVKVIETNGTPYASFDFYGSSSNQLNKPKGIAIDSHGVMYITDSFHGVVMCFDATTGNYLGVIENADEAMTMPKGLSITSMGKLYVAAPRTRSLKIFGINTALVQGRSINITPLALGFNTVMIGDGIGSQSVTVVSNGTNSVTLGVIELSGAEAGELLIVSDNCSGVTLSSLSSCTIEIKPMPTSIGAKSATLVIPSNATDTAREVGLSYVASGRPDIAATPANHDFTSVLIGTLSDQKSLSIINNGAADLTISSIGLTGDNPEDYRIISDLCTGVLMPEETCKIDILFAPASEGTKAASVKIESDDPDEPQILISLTGLGYGYPGIRIYPVNMNFDSLVLDEVSDSLVATVSNIGTTNMTLGSVSITGVDSGDFIVSTDGCSNTLLTPNSSCLISVSFSPVSSTGVKQANIAIPSNDPDNPTSNLLITGRVIIAPQVDIGNETLNSRSRGRWVTIYIELPDGYFVEQINIDSVILDEVNGQYIDPPLNTSGPVEIGDNNGNGVPDLMVKFDRQMLMDLLVHGINDITVTGELLDGTVFEQVSTVNYNE